MFKGVWYPAMVGFLCCVVLGSLAVSVAKSRLEKVAVDAGHAEFYLDDDHNRQWRWLPPCRTEVHDGQG